MLRRLFALALCALCFAGLGASEARGQGAPRVTPPSLQMSGLDARWSTLRDAFGDADAEADAFESLMSAKAELGVLDMPAHSAALLRRAATLAASGDEAGAARFREWALDLAPRSPLPHFAEAAAVAEDGPWRVPTIAGHVVHGYQTLQQTVSGQLALGRMWRELLARSLALFAVLFALALLIRHGGRVSHDARLLGGRALTLGQSSALVALLCVAPALVLWSPFVFVVGAFVLTCVHTSAKERVLALALLGPLACAPMVATDFASLVAVDDRGARLAADAIALPCGDRCEALLARAVQRDGDPDAAVAQAWVEFRRGTGDQRERALATLDAVTPTDVSASSAHVLRGNIAFANHDMDGAQDAYLAAHAAAVGRTQRAVALYGLYRVHSENATRDAAAESVAGALDQDEDMVAPYIGYGGRSQNRLLAVSPLAPAAILAEGFAEADPDDVMRAAQETAEAWLGTVPMPAVAPACLVAGLLLLVGVAAARKKLASVRCTECATPISRFVLAPAYEGRSCVLCYQLEVARADLAPDQIDAREARIERWAEARPNLALIANIAVPGLGLIVAGWTLRGAVVLALFACGITGFLVEPAASQLAFGLGGVPSFDGTTWLAAASLAVAYLSAIAMARRSARGVDA